MRTEVTSQVPRIQVQIVTFNSAPVIQACLGSVMKQSVPIEQVLVIDNNSSDETVKKVKQYGNSVVLIQLSANTGYAAGHNIGFRIAINSDLDFVLTLNPDTDLHQEYLWHAVNEMVTSAQCGGASGKLLRTDGVDSPDTIDSVGLIMERFFHVRDRGAATPDGGQFQNSETTWGVCGAAAVYRVAMLRDLSSSNQDVFDERFFLYKEDVDLCWRGRRRRWQFRYVSSALAFHRRSWKRGSLMSDIALCHSFANQIALLIRHVPRLSLTLVFTVLVETARLVKLFLSRPRAAFRAVGLIRDNWAHHWSERRSLRKRDIVKESTLHDICHPSHL